MVYLLVSLVLGLFYIISGKVKFGKTLYLEGTKARVAGLIFLAPVGLMLAIIVSIAILLNFGINISDSQSKIVDAFGRELFLNGFLIGLAYINFHSVSREAKIRGGCLTFWPAYAIFIALGITWTVLQSNSLAQGIKYAIIGVIVFQIIFVIGIWFWKKWSVWGYAAFTLISPVINLLNTKSIWQTSLSLIISLSTILILYLLVKPKWQFFI